MIDPTPNAPVPTPLSPAAQAVLDAALFEVNAECYAPWIAAAALRAVVLKCEYSDDYGTSFINPDDILAIADELEGQ